MWVIETGPLICPRVDQGVFLLAHVVVTKTNGLVLNALAKIGLSHRVCSGSCNTSPLSVGLTRNTNCLGRAHHAPERVERFSVGQKRKALRQGRVQRLLFHSHCCGGQFSLNLPWHSEG